MADAPAPSSAPASETERTLTVEHVFKAPPIEVFRAWTDPEILKQWWGPEGFTTPEAELDVRPGGAWRSRMIGPDGKDHITSGVFREVVPQKRIVMTWAWETNGKRGHETIIDVTFEPAGNGTRVKLIQRVFETPREAAMHVWGWTSSFAILERLLPDE
jgi:uncharacterized protein YndB with AHSA1/START domain